MDWINLAEIKENWQTLLKAVLKLRVPEQAGIP